MVGLMGAAINDVLADSDTKPGGRTMKPGTVVTDNTGSIFTCVKVVSGQNIVNGNVVFWDGSYNAQVLASGQAAISGTANWAGMGVTVNSITASTSQFIFAQVFGQGNVRVTDTTASNLPGHLMIPGSTPGELTGKLPATASTYISGVVLTATCSVATLTACFINFPRMVAA